MSEYDHEPVRGLPGELPPGEAILWQGEPEWRTLVTSALHVRLVALYFAALLVWSLATGARTTAGTLAVSAVLVLGLAALFLWGVHRTTVYTLTNKRIVLRIGVALNKCINIPLSEIESADLKPLGGGKGSIVLHLKGMPRLGYLMLWPHARSLRIFRPQPILRAIPDAAAVAKQLFDAVRQVQPIVQADNTASGPALEGYPA
ncbi:PH domain-containing protein [Erythrobacter sp. SDW2]|uniref:photosynthetic complex putative assembly protein PuhB n=1 Tax=Erythrobacter sp. SDW2 TaxID=2907154 RepID=UPI001F1FB4C5|nr:photosynthetic complex putative assembly protein PuhB [Erythrobacter sp. SDW2]UIP06886.1 PH domain-containing protein [Erythrobacter sp. SDW2]